ncbi:vesicle transporter SFT2B [Cryptococcus depauperatus CBS 7841]|uniref:Protein transport protein SFT2 n=1 Tax=Cryptococcus depauperatus CBS 7841 TaxID=1295531 RepID=A0AAJ8JQG5_9TREE
MSRKWFNLETQTDDAIFGGQQSAFSGLGLTRTQRIGGFAACFVGGLAISLLGAILLFLGATGAFASLFALGGVISLVGTGFLVGFKTQLEKMFKPVRVVATIILLASIVMTFFNILPTSGILSHTYHMLELWSKAGLRLYGHGQKGYDLEM